MSDPPAPLRPPTLLSVRDVSVQYGDRVALKAVSLEVRAGEFVALTGPNGSGKTTLLRAALGLEPLQSGSIQYSGEELGALSVRQRAKRVAWLPQEELPLDDVRIEDYVMFGRTPYLGLWQGETNVDRSIAARAIAEVGLSDRAESGILELSGGERQRILLARALAQGTPLLLLDEPTAHLDIAYQLDLLGRVQQLCRDGRHAAVAALHDLNLAARFADRALVLSRGKPVVEGPPKRILSEELLRTVWGVAGVLREDPRTGLPYLLPRLAGATPARPVGREELPGPIHLVGGGGAAAEILRSLLEEGYYVTLGPVNVLDSDAQVADEYGVPYPAEVPFAPMGTDVRNRHREMLSAARAIVVSAFAVGPSNLSNLEDLQPFVNSKPMFIFLGREIRSRDFAGGRATTLTESLERSGAVDVEGVADLLPRLRGGLSAPRPSGPPPLPSSGARE